MEDHTLQRSYYPISYDDCVFSRHFLGGRLSYSPITNPSTKHYGQRKLLISEIEFLTKYDARDVLYIGAAPGNHIPLLSELFPDITFHLYDPLHFNIIPSDKVLIYNKYFSLEDANEHKDWLFISDIREAEHKQPTEEEVSSDMKLQGDIIKMVKPRASMVKFRLPFKEGKTPYFKGKIYLPVWGKSFTAESRLIIEGLEIIEYDNREYEEMMSYFNIVQRTCKYPHKYKGCGYDQCYDCRAEIHILEEYLKKKSTLSYVNLIKLSSKIVKLHK